MKDPLMKITDIDKFAKFLAYNTVQDCGIDIKRREIKNYITTKNVEEIIIQYAKRDKKNNLLVNGKILDKIQNDLMDWVLGVSLAKMAAKDELECYWDTERDCMVFATKENDSSS